jgi:hypothetical protein
VGLPGEEEKAMSISYEDRVAWSLAAMTDLNDYWPLTLRQVFYQLVSRLTIPNTQNQYKALSAALSRARKEGQVPWEAIEDRTRPLYGSTGWGSAASFLRHNLEALPDFYQRNLMWDQDSYIELFVEKQALITPFERAAGQYHLLVNMGRGYSSTTVIKEMADRLDTATDGGYLPIILAFSDLDPSGIDLVDNLSRQFLDFDLEPEVERIALTWEQVQEYDLPHDPDALKMTDARAKGFIEEYGEYAVELDALSPATLEQLVREAVESRLDLDSFEEQIKIEAEERQTIKAKIERWLS